MVLPLELGPRGGYVVRLRVFLDRYCKTRYIARRRVRSQKQSEVHAWMHGGLYKILADSINVDLLLRLRADQHVVIRLVSRTPDRGLTNVHPALVGWYHG